MNYDLQFSSAFVDSLTSLCKHKMNKRTCEGLLVSNDSSPQKIKIKIK